MDLLLSKALDPLIQQRLEKAGDDLQDRVDALLDLKVIDPACGSAAILVGALDRIAYAVAKTRSNPHEPRPQDLAHARREVLQSCIYGAEKDPFAAELAKVALWIHCVVPDQPLTFLDHHIVCGDSLVGWPLLNVPTRIEDAAYEVAGVKGAFKSGLTKALRANKAFTERGGDLFQSDMVEFDLALPTALQGPERTPADVRAKAQAFRDWQDSDQYRAWKQTADIWTAAHFWTEDDSHTIPTSRDYAAALEGRPDPAIATEAAAMLADINPIHWPLAFPQVHERGGFDLVVGNPPWEQYKGEEQPFFRQHLPRIAAMTSETRKKAIAELEHTHPAMYARWKTYLAGQGRLAHFAKSSGRYTRTPNEANTYVLFTELAADSSSNVGMIVKSGIATDISQSPVWKRLVAARRVREVVDMVNQDVAGRRVFPAVAAVERFCVLHLGTPTISPLRTSMLNFGVAGAIAGVTREWRNSELALVSPRSMTVLSTNNEDEIRLALKLHARFGTLDFSDADGVNPYRLRYSRLFDSSIAKTKGWLARPDALLRRGYDLQRDHIFRCESQVMLPVMEGQLANRWNHRARTYAGFSGRDMYGRKPNAPVSVTEDLESSSYEVLPRYWMAEGVARDRIAEVAGDGDILVGMRKIGRPWTDRRIVRAMLLPTYTATDALPVFAVPKVVAFSALAVLNSMTLDFLMRIRMATGNIPPWLLSQCAAPAPEEIPERAEQVAAVLSLTSESVAKPFGCVPYPWDDAQRAALDAECDALVALAYGLSTRDYELVLNHFELLEKIETREFGEYRSKRLRLEAFEEIGGGR